MALAGGVSISFPQKKGYSYQEGGIASPDGRCRAFDAGAAGTVPGEGCGIVVLKRLEEAVADGDQIFAVIRGFAINNDGAQKMGYTAPSPEGQAEVIALAQAMAQFEPETISYIETHGTGTPLGDPIEFAGLTKAFRARTAAKGFCAIGSVKSNIGHLDAAAGIAGLIKTALALKLKRLPPSLHFKTPNPMMDLGSSPFYVNTADQAWKSNHHPRRAGVSAFGIGGTNAHVVLEESLAIEPSGPARPHHLLVLSARTTTALETLTQATARDLSGAAQDGLANVAWTLATGRRHFTHRRAVVCRDAADAAQALTAVDSARVLTRSERIANPMLVFQFPGQGAQYVNMGLEAYQYEAAFRETLDHCCDLLQQPLGLDLRTILHPEPGREAAAALQLRETAITQPALFAIEYSLAAWWRSLELEPAALIGHSIGEYVAACVAGVFDLEDALNLVATRGRLMQQLPRGAMLAVRLPEHELRPWLDPGLAIATVNAPSLCVASGSSGAIQELRQKLDRKEIACTPLDTSHAFHSPMMEPIMAAFRKVLKGIPLRTPKIPFVSNVSGAWITAQQATNTDYWVLHLRHTVRFGEGLRQILNRPGSILLEVGPGQTLTRLAGRQALPPTALTAIPSFPQAHETKSEVESLLNAVGQLWLAGLPVNWKNLYARERRLRVSLPTYPFERKRHWIEPVPAGSSLAAAQPAPAARPAPGCVEETGKDGTGPSPAGTTHGLPAHQVGATPGSQSLNGSDPVDFKPGIMEEPGQKIRLREIRSLFGRISGWDLSGTGPQTTFVEMGFDSLFLSQAARAIEKQYGLRIAFRQLLKELSNFESLAAHIQQALEPQHAADPARAACHGSNPERLPLSERLCTSQQGIQILHSLPLTADQREVWLATQLGDAASCAFIESCLWHLDGDLNRAALQKALAMLVSRHEALRTTFSAVGDVQHVHSAMPVEIAFTDLADLPEARRGTECEALFAESVSRPFDLVQGPLVRARLVRLAGKKHVLVLALHHLICDGRSLAILLGEWAALYSEQCGARPATLPAPFPFHEYAQRQEELERSSAAEVDEAFWLERLQGELPVLELPADRPRPAVRSYRAAREARTLPPALADSLRSLGARHGCTLFTTLLSAHYALLHRLTNQTEILVGIPTASRPDSSEKVLLGHTVTMLPLRARVPLEQPFHLMMSLVQSQLFEAFEHPRCAFGRLLQKLNIPRDASRPPVVSATFTMDRILHRMGLPGLDTVLTPNPKAFCYFDLSFSVLAGEDGLVVDCRFNRDLFEVETIRCWLAHYQTLLEGVVVSPDLPVAKLPLLTPAERHQLLVQWNDTRVPYPGPCGLHHLFEEQVERTPQATALVFEDQQLSYAELNRRANQVAHYLRKRGVGRETLVGICLERSVEMVVGLLGILKAGGAYLPLDPACPRERLAFMLADTKPPLLLAQEKVLNALRLAAPSLSPAGGEGGGEGGRLLDYRGEAICLDTDWPGWAGQPEDNPDSGVQPENLVYVIYTSGSTGQPKGVMNMHRGVSNRLRWMIEYLPLAADDRVLHKTPFTFDVSAWELFSPLARGACLVVARPGGHQDAAYLVSLIQQQRITTAHFVPSMLRVFLDQPGVSECRSLRRIICSGETLHHELQERFFERMQCELYNFYGPTEASIEATAWKCERNSDRTIVPIGRPIANMQTFILDELMQPVPPGVPGELCLGGVGVARGYLNREALTAEKFIANPFSQNPEARLYRTGDQARYLADGNIEFLGRRDQQVKLRGVRIELQEVEAVLGRHPAIQECAAAVREWSPGDLRLVAYFVARNGAGPDARELRHFLEDKLPESSVPSFFMELPVLPRSASGKVNRGLLPAPERPDGAKLEETSACATATERELSGIWREVLGIRCDSIHANFFELGGHSLLATQVISRIRQKYGLEFPLRALFEAPTLSRLAKLIESALHAAQDRPAKPSPPPYPFSTGSTGDLPVPSGDPPDGTASAPARNQAVPWPLRLAPVPPGEEDCARIDL